MDKEYTEARLKLTALYVFIILGIILFFSTALVGEQFLELNRIAQYHYQIVSDPFGPPQIVKDAAIEDVVNEAKFNTIARTIGIDIILLAASIGVSYYLSGKTLEPIHKTFVKQKKFIANASHELKTPLTAMKTQAEIILKSDRSKEEYKEYVKSTLEETDKLTQLTYALLDVARSDSNTRSLHPEIFNLVAVINEQVKMITPLLEEKQIQLEQDLPKHVDILADKSRIGQLLSILLDNAIKYNKDKGTIVIRIVEHEEQIVLEIQDTGIGIAKQHQQKIFDRFFRVSEDRNIPGYGLGLSIAKQIATEAHATIALQSIESEGTTVSVTLPKSK